ncbi:MAG: sensor histidine kinase KdpD [Gammaproteobacteria bacterium]|jgi:two-component system sensor histidine kinase KdpD|nr:sensor histidine kinase KdpD [Gammaproteobacteria bacterium]
MEDDRPDPEQLLRQVKEESKHLGRGKLKIFFGACAGSGKTYAMLSSAQEKRRENVDVVAGIIETHGRSETNRLLEGLPRLPLKHIQYQGITIKELDIDAAIERKPSILLVDELAHTNAIGSRHPKRWQDVQELLECGIDVYTTVNVQHLESLNDVVANLTGIKVKETVPDSIFDNADEIVLVDVPSEVIIERLNDGKVYLGEFAKQRAAQHFFKIENLIALREVALRRTAERVDALRDIYKKYQSKRQAISDKILVCVGPGNLSTKLVRNAKQLATKLKCQWTALHIENDQHYALAKEEQNFIKKTLSLAEQLGAKVVTKQQSNTTQAIIDFAKRNNFTKIIVGKSTIPKWKRWFVHSMVHDIIEESGSVDVYIITDDTPVPKLKMQRSTPSSWLSILNTMFIIALCTIFGLPARDWLEPETVLMIYLTGVVIVATSNERGSAVLAALLSVICYNFFFIYPYYNLATYHLRDIITLSVLLLTGLVISTQTSRLQQQNIYTRQRERYTAELYNLSRKLIVTPGKAKIAKVLSHHIGEIFDCAATVWLPNEENNLEIVSHPGIKTELKEESVATWAYKHHQVAGLGTDTMPSARGYYIPISNGELTFGVLGIIPKELDRTFSAEEDTLLESLTIQTASAFERVELAEKMLKEKGSKSN